MTVKVGEVAPRPLFHPGFVGAGSTLLIAALLTDAMYWKTALVQWSNFSAWLISAGLVLALVSVMMLIVDLATGRAGRINWLSLALVAVAALLSLLNVLVHSRDAWTSVVPDGIGLSAAVSVLLLIAALRGWRITASRIVDIGEGP